MPSPRPAPIARLDQMSVLASPIRQEMLDMIARVGRPVCLTEVGSLLGRPSDGLYYHARMLEKSGLLKSSGSRTRQGRRETRFRAVAPQFILRYPKSGSRSTRALVSIVGSLLRLGLRDFRRALAGGQARTDGPTRDLWALRTTGWLRPEHVRRVNRLIQTLADEASRTEPKGRLYAVSVLLAPLDHRSNRTGRRPRRRGRA